MAKIIEKLTVEIDTTALDAAMEKAERLVKLLDEIEQHFCLKDLDAFVQKSIRHHNARRA
jgi:hypothetical protein